MARQPGAAPGSSHLLVTPMTFQENKTRKGSNVARSITASDFVRLLLYNPAKEIKNT